MIDESSAREPSESINRSGSIKVDQLISNQITATPEESGTPPEAAAPPEDCGAPLASVAPPVRVAPRQWARSRSLVV